VCIAEARMRWPAALPSGMAVPPWASQELEDGRNVGAAVGEAFVREIPMAVDVIRILGAILLPPLGICLAIGLGGRCWLSIPLKLIGCVLGIVHAVRIIARG
jgi:uncharacterized membrane protein YqaE (UPF0057 family)